MKKKDISILICITVLILSLFGLIGFLAYIGSYWTIFFILIAVCFIVGIIAE